MTLLGESQRSAPVTKKPTEIVKEKMPAAGPHARAELTNFDACPGAGALPSEKEIGGESDPGAG
jgi:hypothetical protein